MGGLASSSGGGCGVAADILRRGYMRRKNDMDHRRYSEILKATEDVDLDEPVVATNSSLRAWLQLRS